LTADALGETAAAGIGVGCAEMTWGGVFSEPGSWSLRSQRWVTGSRGQSARLTLARFARSAFLMVDGIGAHLTYELRPAGQVLALRQALPASHVDRSSAGMLAVFD